MIIDAFSFTLKDGRTATIRTPQEKDIPKMLSYLRQSAGETEYIMRYPEECDIYTVEYEKAVFERVNQSNREVMLLCLVDEEIIANCMMRWADTIKTRHRASIAIKVRKDYWNLGIGTRLMEELLRIAKNQPEIRQVELEFIQGNNRARTLYEKMGFRIVGVKPNAICLKDGTLLHEYMMMFEIKR